MSNKLLLAGVGALNQRVADQAQATATTVVGLRRSEPDPQLGFVQHSIDLAEQAWPDLGVDQVVIALSARDRSLEAYRAAYTRPLQQLLASIPDWQRQPSRVVVVSSTRVYGSHQGDALDDSSRAIAEDEYGEILLDMEQTAQQLPCDVVIARLSGIYGPGRDWLKRMALAADPAAPPQNSWTNRIHIDDAARAIWHLLTQAEVPPTVLVTDTAPQTRYAMYNYFRRQQGLPLLSPEPEPVDGKRLLPSFLQRSGFVWRYPDAFSGGYDGS